MRKKIEYMRPDGKIVPMSPGAVVKEIVRANPGATWFRVKSGLLSADGEKPVTPVLLRQADHVVRSLLDGGWLIESEDHLLYLVKRCAALSPRWDRSKGGDRQCRLPEYHESDHWLRWARSGEDMTWKREEGQA